MKTENTKEHLCDSCLVNNVPECMSDDTEFGDGFGNDNIIQCENYEKKD